MMSGYTHWLVGALGRGCCMLGGFILITSQGYSLRMSPCHIQFICNYLIHLLQDLHHSCRLWLVEMANRKTGIPNRGSKRGQQKMVRKKRTNSERVANPSPPSSSIHSSIPSTRAVRVSEWVSLLRSLLKGSHSSRYNTRLIAKQTNKNEPITAWLENAY